MYNFPIGIMMHSLREDDKTAIESAAAMGVQGLQFLGTYGEHSAEEMTKEKRKELPSKEGKLGVEGIDNEILINALIASGHFNENTEKKYGRAITAADLFEAGLSGGENSSENL